MKRASAIVIALLASSGVAHAQMRGGGAGAGGAQQHPTQSGPVQNRSVGPRAGDDNGDDTAPRPRTTVTQRPTTPGEPTAPQPVDPLSISPEAAAIIGTDADIRPPAPVGETKKSFFPIYEERKGDYRFRMVPPLFLEHTRGLPTETPAYGEPTKEDREGLYGLLFYQRRSPDFDADIVFPLAWRIRDKANHAYVLGPIAHREAPGEHDNWLAPLVFEGERKDGGYFHSPLLLTTSHWNADKAFTLTGPYFRDRSGRDVDWGVAPFYFRGDNGDIDGARRTYTVVPPLLYFHKEAELEESQMTLIGPVITRTNPKRAIFDVAPLFFHIQGRPQASGVDESHTTLFPLFHYGYSPEQKLFVLPGYLRRVTPTVDTMLTPFYSHSTTRSGSTSLTALGPIVPLYWHYSDKDTNELSWAMAPFWYQSNSPAWHDWLTPLVGRFETYGVSRTWWAAPGFLYKVDTKGWETDAMPFAWVGRHEDSSHTVLAPVFWDFASKEGRTTIGAPFYWRFADTKDSSVTQVAMNTLYMQKRVPGGIDWQFHVLPLFSYGEEPEGAWWNVMFGLVGFKKTLDYTRIKAFSIPITVSGSTEGPPRAKAASVTESSRY